MNMCMHIIVILVFQVCPPTSEYARVFSEADVKDKGCTFPEALKTIEEKCHGQEACSMVTAPEIFGSGLPSYNGGDPCPGVSYFKVEFFFKFYGKL